jgi:hypothetical protein
MSQTSSIRSGPRSSTPDSTITLIQHSCFRSWDVFLSLFNSLTSHNFSLTLVLLQDPPVFRRWVSFFAGYKSFIPPPSDTPRVEPYASSLLLEMVALVSSFPAGACIMHVDLHQVDSSLGLSFPTLRITNLYSIWAAGFSPSRSIQPSQAFPRPSLRTIVAGNFNIHNPELDPLRPYRAGELTTSAPYLDLA